MQEGRPTKYDPKINRMVEKFCKLGATDSELAEMLDISESTLYLWKNEHPEFSEALKKGKALADAEVAEKLYCRATGYSHPEVDIKVIDGQIVQTRLTRHYPPDTAAAIFWLKNRQRKKWRDKVESGFTDGEGNDIPVTIFNLPDNARGYEIKEGQ